MKLFGYEINVNIKKPEAKVTLTQDELKRVKEILAKDKLKSKADIIIEGACNESDSKTNS